MLAQKAKGVENILLVKAGRENFTQTNLSVITTDGKLYSFVIDYINNPIAINFSFETDTSIINAAGHPKPLYTEADIQMDAKKVLMQKRSIHGMNDFRYQVQLSVTGIYIKNNVIFFQIILKNNSNINYDIDMLRFFVHDERRFKRTASQEIDIQPLNVCGDTSVIKGRSKTLVVFALPKFTIPNNKYLSIQLMEEDGGRHLQLRIYNRTILKAKPIN